LLAARAALPGAAPEGEGRVGGFEAWWRAWVPGDAPEELVRLAREFELAPERGAGPLGQGAVQGLLGWLAKILS